MCVSSHMLFPFLVWGSNKKKHCMYAAIDCVLSKPDQEQYMLAFIWKMENKKKAENNLRNSKFCALYISQPYIFQDVFHK